MQCICFECSFLGPMRSPTFMGESSGKWGVLKSFTSAHSGQSAPTTNQIGAGALLDFRYKEITRTKKITQLNPDNLEDDKNISNHHFKPLSLRVTGYIAIDNLKRNQFKKSYNLNKWIHSGIFFSCHSGTWAIAAILPLLNPPNHCVFLSLPQGLLDVPFLFAIIVCQSVQWPIAECENKFPHLVSKTWIYFILFMINLFCLILKNEQCHIPIVMLSDFLIKITCKWWALSVIVRPDQLHFWNVLTGTSLYLNNKSLVLRSMYVYFYYTH